MLKRVALIAVFALLAMGIGGAAGAQEITGDQLAGVAGVNAGPLLLAQPDARVVIAQPNPGEIIGAIIGVIIAYAGLALGEGVMNAAVALGAGGFGLWQIGKNIWDAACGIGQQADSVLGGQPTFVYICTLYPRWPY